MKTDTQSEMTVRHMKPSKATQYIIVNSTETSFLTSCGAELDFAGGAPRVIFHVESDEEEDRFVTSPRPVPLRKKDEEIEPMFPFSIKRISKQQRPWRRNLQDFRMRLHYGEHFQMKIVTATMRSLLYWVFANTSLRDRPGSRDIMRKIATFLPPSRKRKISAYPVVNPMDVGEYRGLSLLERRSPSPRPCRRKVTIAKQSPSPRTPITPKSKPVEKVISRRSASPVAMRPLEKKVKKKRGSKKDKEKDKDKDKSKTRTTRIQDTTSPRPMQSTWRP